MTDRRIPSAAVVVLASAIAAAGMAAHNVLEFGPAFLLDPETLIPLAIFGLFALLAWAINPLLAVDQLAHILIGRAGLPAVFGLGEDHAAVQDPAYQEAADRVAGKERVEKTCHPDLVPHDIALDEG